MFPIYPEEQAKIECLKLMKELDEGLLSSFVADDVLKNAPGQMFGVAICRKVKGLGSSFMSNQIPEQISEELVVLRAFSGQLAGEGRWLVEGFVPPCINVSAWEKEVQRADPQIKALTAKIDELQKTGADENLILQLKANRRELSNESLRNIYEMYEFTCWDGHKENYGSLTESLGKTDMFAIPTGTGDCCAPKLINFAFQNNLQIISMAEFFYGNEPRSLLKRHKEFYPPCDEKCGLLLPKMIGLNILFRDENILVVNKPSGVLSAPGKGEEKFDCIPFRVRCLIPECIVQPCVHRLDMDTSGILVLGITKQAHRNLSMQFEARKVSKMYKALLRGKLSEKIAKGFGENSGVSVNDDGISGLIDFPMRVDLENRPYQIYDEEYGRAATTQWKILKEYDLKNPDQAGICHRTLIEYKPLTGRTHQLRLHSAQPEKGFGIPIVGDRLYGSVFSGERLCLQAFYLEFFHPVTEEKMSFQVDEEF